jgi:hypothetical protein
LIRPQLAPGPVALIIQASNRGAEKRYSAESANAGRTTFGALDRNMPSDGHDFELATYELDSLVD